jgi:hypothetical protein
MIVTSEKLENRESVFSPVRVGIPFALGTKTDSLEDLVVCSSDYRPLQSNLTPIGYWHDGSVQWACVDLIMDVAKIGPLRLVSKTVNSKEIYPQWDFVKLEPQVRQGCLLVDLVQKDSKDSRRGLDLSVEVSGNWGRSILKFDSVALGDNSKNELAVGFDALASLKIESLELPIEFQLSGRCWCTGQIDISLRVCNPNAASHLGGNWDLGNAGSAYLNDVSLKLELVSAISADKLIVRETFTSMIRSAEESIQLFQASSGGTHWNSLNHIDRHRKIPMPFRGYRLDIDRKESIGERATPYVAIQCDGVTVGVACKRFWQNFPVAIRTSAKGIEVGLFPKEGGHDHELQGGEQKTFQFAAYFGHTPADAVPLDGYLSDPCPVFDPEYLEFTSVLNVGSVRLFEDQVGLLYETLVNQAIEGSDSFFSKRERIDEYGWRHYGDVYGDHEAVYHKGPSPMISHYNNQYDCVLGFFYQFMRSGDPRWYEQLIAMADHAWDIDTYHTTQDKLLYNGGLFWHTYHYADADTGTHRSYPRALLQADHFDSGKDLEALGSTGRKLKAVYGKGGGPAASQNYSTGWKYAYYLTGESRYREAAINAADYVIQIEDSSKTPFRWLSAHPTGYSTCSSEGYYGPGRASANSTHALLTGYELTADRKYLDMAVSLMRRTVHPEQNLEKLDLLNAELRWFYTMYLQALSRLIEVLAPQENLRDDFLYAVGSLMRYAGWMLKHERPILDTPEKLQYPTETWAAQDIRKWQVLAYAAKWAASDQEQRALIDRSEFFFQYCMETLESFSTKSLCRPVVLLLNYGWQRTGLQKAPRIGYPVPPDYRFGEFKAFVPQRTVALGRAKKILMGAAVVFCMALVAGIAYLMRS